jgi:spoIIIJ-associated protein
VNELRGHEPDRAATPGPEANDDEAAAGPDGEVTADRTAYDDERSATPDEAAEVAEDFLRGLLEALGMPATLSASVEDDRAVIDVAGEDMGILIGRRGQTLEALQELARTAVQRRLRSRVRLLVDVEGYRARRRASLADYARAMARRARERGTEIELEPMNAYERKIVHDAIAEVEGASSFSEGEEPNRKVIVRGE